MATSQIERLEVFCKQLREAIDDFEHELRRCSDALERAGGRSSRYERRMLELRQNRDLNIKELQRAQQKIVELRKETGTE